MRSISPIERYGRFVPQADANLRVHVFNATETVTGLAFRYYGDPRYWRLIAVKNEIRDVRKIAAGTKLLIPQKPAQRGRYVSL